MILVTGGAGFIGSNFVLDWLGGDRGPVINLDKLTYSGNRHNLLSIDGNDQHIFVEGDIGDRVLVRRLLEQYHPTAIVHFAAESHVDRSIHDPGIFIQTNVLGTHALLEEALIYWKGLPEDSKRDFRFLHVSTDEVYGSLEPDEAPFCETTPFRPNSPYSASKAASDHLVRAYHHTFGLPTLTSNCSNNYGPYQFPEKLIPLMILNALQGKTLPVYGDGLNERNWLYVLDHCHALRLILKGGRIGETYNIGAGYSISNRDVIHNLCGILDTLNVQSSLKSHSELIRYVNDRPGHDRRYDVDASKLQSELGWRPLESFETGLHKTVEWYLQNTDWLNKVSSGEYRHWIGHHYHSKERV